MRFNGKTIGTVRTTGTTSTATKGVWTLSDQQQAKGAGQWPNTGA